MLLHHTRSQIKMCSRVIPVCLRFGKAVIETNGNNSAVNRYASYSSYRNLWNNIINKKPASAEVKNETESGTKDPNTSDNDTKTCTTDFEKELKIQVEELTKAVEEFKQNNETLNDKYKRALADGENLRMRLTKQIEEAKIFGIQGFCKDLLDVADVLGKATECVPKEEVSDSNPHLKNLYEGLTMTETQLKKVFERHGLIAINPLDEKFNPNVHEALFQQEVEGKDPGTVVVVSKIGYKLRERVIRPALVGVSK